MGYLQKIVPTFRLSDLSQPFVWQVHTVSRDILVLPHRGQTGPSFHRSAENNSIQILSSAKYLIASSKVRGTRTIFVLLNNYG